MAHLQDCKKWGSPISVRSECSASSQMPWAVFLTNFGATTSAKMMHFLLQFAMHKHCKCKTYSKFNFEIFLILSFYIFSSVHHLFFLHCFYFSFLVASFRFLMINHYELFSYISLRFIKFPCSFRIEFQIFWIMHFFKFSGKFQKCSPSSALCSR